LKVPVMLNYVIRRLIQAVVLLFLISIILFILMNESGDPLATMGGRRAPRAEDRERLERQLGLDQPMLVQYSYWLIGNEHVMIDVDGDGEGDVRGRRKGVLRGDFGVSIVTRQPALEVIMDRLPNTLILMVSSQLVIIVVSLVIGIYSALRQYSLVDHLLTGFSFVTYSMPIFFIAILLIYLFGIQFREWGLPHLPAQGMYDPVKGRSTDQILVHLILPVMSLSLIGIAQYSRYIRSSMLEVLNSDYIRTAHAKGLPPHRVFLVHALRNAILPVVTLIGLDLPLLLAGAVVTEQIFAWPGMGRLFIDHLHRADFPVMMGLLLMISAAVVIFQLVTDLFYTVLDPRIRLS
jgi:peptide/nickel transport system permease protein